MGRVWADGAFFRDGRNSSSRPVVQHSTAQHSATQHGTQDVALNTQQHNAPTRISAQRRTAQVEATQHHAAPHNTAQHTTAQYMTAQSCCAPHRGPQQTVCALSNNVAFVPPIALSVPCCDVQLLAGQAQVATSDSGLPPIQPGFVKQLRSLLRQLLWLAHQTSMPTTLAFANTAGGSPSPILFKTMLSACS